MNYKGTAVLREAQLVMLKILKEVDRVCNEHKIPYWIHAGTLLGAVRHGGFIPWDDDLDICMLREDYERFLLVAPISLSKDFFLQNIATDKHITCSWTKVRDRNSKIVEEENAQYHQGIFIDIFPFDKLPRSSVHRFLSRTFFNKVYKICRSLTKQRSGKKKFKNIILKNIASILNVNMKSAPKIEEKYRKYAVVQSNRPENFSVSFGVGLRWNDVFEYDDIFPLTKIQFEDSLFYAPNKYKRYLTISYGDYMKLPKEEDRTTHAKELKVDLTEEEKARLNRGFD
jgi:LPS biosynthesis protein